MLKGVAKLIPTASKIVVEKGQIVKVSKDKDGIVTREQLTKGWTDWIDYWAVDFNFESKREIVRVKNRGVPHDRGNRGDLLVKINIEFPKKISKDARMLIEKLRVEGL